MDVTRQLSHIRMLTEEEQQQMQEKIEAQGMKLPSNSNAADGFDEKDQATWGEPSRNEKCPCGSGKKFKHCHGKL